MSIVALHLDQLRSQFPHAQAENRPDGTVLVTLPEIDLPDGLWNRQKVTVEFLAPVGYPMAHPDCFWTDENLRLSGGGIPKNSQVQVPPFTGSPRLWFSWHVSRWNSSRDTLKTYARIVLDRLSRSE